MGVVDGLLYAVGGHDGPTVRKSAEVFHPQVSHPLLFLVASLNKHKNIGLLETRIEWRVN